MADTMKSIQYGQCRDHPRTITLVHPAETPLGQAIVELAKWMSLLMIPIAMGIAAWLWMFLSLEGVH